MTPSRSRCETISIGESGRRSGLCRATHGDVIPQVSGAEALCRVLSYRAIPAQLIVNDAGHASGAATRLDAIHPARQPCAAAASVPHRSRPGPNSDVRDWCRRRTSASCSRPQMCQVRASLPRCCGMMFAQVMDAIADCIRWCYDAPPCAQWTLTGLAFSPSFCRRYLGA